MLECFCDCVGIDFPFTAEDFLTEQDIDMINGNVIPQTVLVQSENIRWQNWSSDKMPTATKSGRWSGGTEDNQQAFNGFATISNVELKRKVSNWLHETFHPDFLQNNWETGFGLKTPPVTVLCFSKSTGWHKEGPVTIPATAPKDFNTTYLDSYRHPGLCNFRLLGDKEGSSLEFAKPSEKMWNAELELIEQFCQESHDAFPKSITTLLNDMTITDPQHWLTNPEVWEDELEIITEHVGMHNPYMVNINQWHRVKTNGTPRVTLRVHGSHKLTFKQMEEMFDTGKMFI